MTTKLAPHRLVGWMLYSDVEINGEQLTLFSARRPFEVDGIRYDPDARAPPPAPADACSN